MAFGATSGSVTFTADSVIGTSGKPVRIFSIYWIKEAGAEPMVVRSGTSASDTIIIESVSTANDGNLLDFGPEGILFPSGAFYDEGTAITSATFTFRTEA